MNHLDAEIGESIWRSWSTAADQRNNDFPSLEIVIGPVF